jgi:hypothetical protein
MCAEIMPKISFEFIACPLMKPCFTQLELLSVQRYAAQKSSSSYIHRIPVWGEVLCLTCEQGIWATFFCRKDHYRHTACLDITDLCLILQLKLDFDKTFPPLTRSHTPPILNSLTTINMEDGLKKVGQQSGPIFLDLLQLHFCCRRIF